MEHPEEGDRMERRDADEADAHLDLVGIQSGDTILDAGCASGWLTRRIARRAHPGRATGVDQSARRIAQARRIADTESIPNIDFVEGDLYDLPFQDNRFDRAISRYTFEYLDHPETALAEMIRVTRPGGSIAIADLDGNGLLHYPMPPLLEHLGASLTRRLDQLGFDPFIGRKLFTLCHRAGLKSIRVHALPHHLTAGRASPRDLENWAIKLKTIRPHIESLFPSSSAYDRFMEQCLEHLRRPDSLTWSLTFFVVGVV